MPLSLRMTRGRPYSSNSRSNSERTHSVVLQDSARALSCSTTECVRSEFERLFEEYGLPRVIRSDNGIPFACRHGLLGLTRLSAWWLVLGIDLDRICPGDPGEKGAPERKRAKANPDPKS